MSRQGAQDLAERFGIPTTEVRFGPSEAVFLSGNRDWVGQITGGVVRIYSVNDAGASVTHRNQGAGGLIGIGALLGDGERVTAESVGSTVVKRFDFHAVRRLWRTDPAFCQAVAADLFETLLRTYDRNILNLRGTQVRRLAIELLDRAEGTEDGLLTVHASHEDLANSIGSSREVVTRQLKAMASRGLVGQARNRAIAVMDLTRLLDFAMRGASFGSDLSASRPGPADGDG